MKTLFIDCDAHLTDSWASVYRADDPPIDVNTEKFARDAVPKVAAGYQIIIDDHTYFPADILERCTSLKHIVYLGTGASSYVDMAAAERLGIGVSTIKGYGDTAVAEHAIALMLAASRDVARMDREIRAGEWHVREGVQLRGKVLGLVGFGGVGREVARIAGGMGMEVLAWNRSRVETTGARLVGLEELLRHSDVISLHLGLNDETRGFLDTGRLAITKKGVIIVNTARGAVIDDEALIAALASGHVRHAALDVFDPEPLPAGHRFASIENVTLTAHAAWSTPDAVETLMRRAIDLVRDARGKLASANSRG
jgi:D-3-phosphoglycerate dehydrogenase / 2-oxoglutarate reductase